MNDLIRYGWIRQDEETNRISIHLFLNEVLEITDRPSFLKCQQFMEHVGNEYITDVKDEIFYRDLLSLTKSIFKKIVVDDTFLAFSLLEKILKYLEKYVYYNTMKDMLKLFEQILMTGKETPYQTATYQFYMGVKACWELKPETGAEYFQNAVSLLKPFDKSNAELAINIYHKLSEIYALSADQKLLLPCAQSMVELRTLYGSTVSPDYEYENLMLALASKDINNMKLEEILEMPELETFAQRARKENIFNVPKEDFLKDIEKVEPNELNQMKSICQNIKDDLQDIVLSQQEDISFTDIMTRVFKNAEKYIKTDDLCN